MQVGSATSTTSTSSATPAVSPANLVNYNQFLQLLVAQMKNQDPTNPTDSSQYLSQLASFSAVEQAVQTNSKLDQLIQTSGLDQADSLIGHTLTTADGSVSGKVVSVTLSKGGVSALLDNGQTLPVTSG